MEDKQMRQYTFFSKIGAFSINLEDPKASISSLRYAVDSMKRDHACLFIYPEGRITPVSENEPNFRKGLAWLYQNLDDIDFVPIAIYSHTLRSSKPELYLAIGNSVDHDKSLSKNELTVLFQQDLHRIITQTREVAGFTDEGFDRQF